MSRLKNNGLRAHKKLGFRKSLHKSAVVFLNSFFLLLAFPQMSYSGPALVTPLPDYNQWAIRIEPMEFRGGNHNDGKSVNYQLQVDVVTQSKSGNNKNKTEKKLLEVSPISVEPLEWRIPTEQELANLTMLVSGDDFRKTITSAMSTSKLAEDQIKVEVKLSAFKKPWIPYVKKPEFLGSIAIDPESELSLGTPLQKEITLGQGGILKFKVIPIGIKVKK